MIHAEVSINSIVAHPATHEEFFNGLSQELTLSKS
jgi:hypothetical protein